MTAVMRFLSDITPFSQHGCHLKFAGQFIRQLDSCAVLSIFLAECQHSATHTHILVFIYTLWSYSGVTGSYYLAKRKLFG